MAAERGSAVKPDVRVLRPEQQEKLRQFKIRTRIENEMYLRSHPEVDVLIGDFLRDVLHKRPDDVREFAADYFTNPDLQATLASKMKDVDPELDDPNNFIEASDSDVQA